LRWPVHRGDDLLPSLLINLETRSVGEKPLGSLPAALDKELRQGLAMNLRGLLEEGLIVLVDAQVDPLGLGSH